MTTSLLCNNSTASRFAIDKEEQKKNVGVASRRLTAMTPKEEEEEEEEDEDV